MRIRQHLKSTIDSIGINRRPGNAANRHRMSGVRDIEITVRRRVLKNARPRECVSIRTQQDDDVRTSRRIGFLNRRAQRSVPRAVSRIAITWRDIDGVRERIHGERDGRHVSENATRLKLFDVLRKLATAFLHRNLNRRPPRSLKPRPSWSLS